MLTDCKSSVEVINAWKSDKLNTIVDQNILVITRSENNKKRGAFEEQIVAHLKQKKSRRALVTQRHLFLITSKNIQTKRERSSFLR